MTDQTKQYLQENIVKYSKLHDFTDYATDLPSKVFTKEENLIVLYIQNMIPSLCNRYLQKQISKKDLEAKANYIMFDRYNPLILGKVLKREVVDFIMILGEIGEMED